jgi:hypothetical protein
MGGHIAIVSPEMAMHRKSTCEQPQINTYVADLYDVSGDSQPILTEISRQAAGTFEKRGLGNWRNQPSHKLAPSVRQNPDRCIMRERPC